MELYARDSLKPDVVDRIAFMTHPRTRARVATRRALWSLFSVSLALGHGGLAHAQEGDANVGLDGLPGVHRVITAQSMAGVGISADAGYGFSRSVFGLDDAHHRAAGVVSVTAGVTSWLAFGLRLDGRYDRHSLGDVDMAPTIPASDDSWVGDPRLLVQVSRALSPRWYVGGKLSFWLPGANAPSIESEAVSGDIVLALGHVTASRKLRIGANVGFRVDNSAAIIDNADDLSRPDRLSLGVGDANALLLGIGVAYRLGQAELFGEWTWDKALGDRAPSPDTSPLRLAAGARFAISPALVARISVEANVASLPDATPQQPLSPYEPRVAVMTGVSFRFGGRAASEPDILIVAQPPETSEPTAPKTEPRALTGSLATDSGTPVTDATAQLTVGTHTDTVTVDENGRFSVPIPVDITAETAEITITAEGFKDATYTVDLSGDQPLTVTGVLEPALPRGQLRGVVRAYSGKPLAAEITVEALGVVTQTDSEGAFEIDVPPGTYTVVIRAPRYKKQKRKVSVQDGGVTIVQVDLRRQRRRR